MSNLKRMIPKGIRVFLNQVKGMFVSKKASEIGFWKKKLKEDKGRFFNDHYKKLMLAIAGESSDNFMKNKVVADFGSGPRGSLSWVESTDIKIGIDVLADTYSENFKDNIISHDMIYLKCTEKVIPLPTGFVDVLISINAIDHVNCFKSMCNELLRILKPGGFFYCSFNLEEPATPSEPQRLTEEFVNERLLQYLEVESYRITRQGPEDDPYRPFFENQLDYQKGQEGFLWVKAQRV